MRLTFRERSELHHLERVANALSSCRAVERHAPQAVAHVLLDGHVREQRIGLEHHVHRALVRRDCGHVLIVDHDPAGAGSRETGQHAQQRGLTAARGAHQGEHLALVDAQVDAVHGRESAEGLVDPFDDDLRLRVGIEPGLVGDRFRLSRQHALAPRTRPAESHGAGSARKTDARPPRLATFCAPIRVRGSDRYPPRPRSPSGSTGHRP